MNPTGSFRLFIRSTLWLALTWLFAIANASAQNRPLGVDVSSHQACVDWSSVKAAGRSFAFMRAAEASPGWGYIATPDPQFSYNATNAKSAGVYVGYYHFVHPELDYGTGGADTEANYFWSVVSPYTKADGLTLMPMLDFEQNVTSASPAYTATTLSQWANEWCSDLVNKGKSVNLNIKPIFYTFPSYVNGGGGYGPGCDSTITQWTLNMATVYYSDSYAETSGHGPSTSPWSTWAFWQYNWTNTVAGIDGRCGGEAIVDVDTFNGTLAQMTNSYVVTTIGPTITNQPSSFTIPVGGNVAISVGSPNATHYQWQFNGTNIHGAVANTYSVFNAQLTNAGCYTAVVSNTGGTTISSNAYLSVYTTLSNAPGAVIAPTNLVDWWPAEGNAIDISGTDNGTQHGILSYVPGESGQAFHFDGASSFITTSGGDLAPPWTVCMWVNYSHTSQTSAGLLENGTNGIKLEQYGSSTHNIGISQIGYTDSTFNYAAPTGTWTHLAFVGTSNSVTLYANGVSKGSLSTNNCPLPRKYIGAGYVPSTGLYIDYMLGSMDELMMFNRALKTNEISSIYNAGAATLIRAPQLTKIQPRTSPRVVTINVEGMTGKSVTLYSSKDLVNWSNVTTLSLTSGTATYVTPSTNVPGLFYRLSQPY